jgi:hypothetical protein
MVTSNPIPCTFKATDSIGPTDSLAFSIDVFGSVGAAVAAGIVHGPWNLPQPLLVIHTSGRRSSLVRHPESGGT